jgi:signal transduction histidine kinase
MMRSSAVSLALGYVALGLIALVLFAAPLWYAWQGTIRAGRTEILKDDAQRLADVYRRDGALGLKNFIDARVRMQLAGERNVSNSIAHDLRTPLAELRSRLEELALIRPSRTQTFAEIDGAVADVDRVIRIFDALLRLAEIDAGMSRSGFVAVDAAELAATAVEFYAPAAELKRVTLEFHGNGPTPVAGDPVLLAQALGNLIDNALKFAPDGGRIEVAVQRRPDGAAHLAVRDNGPGISDPEKTKVVERFYRGDASRGTPGVGLGLSLVHAVAKLHGGALELSDRSPGLSALLSLPPDPKAADARVPAADSRTVRPLTHSAAITA